MLIILLLAFQIVATHLRPHSVGARLRRLYWFSLLGSHFVSFFFLPWCVRAGSSCGERRGSGVGHLRGRLPIFFLFLFYYQKTESQMTSSTVCALPSPVTFPPLSVMKWSQSLLLRGCRERNEKFCI